MKTENKTSTVEQVADELAAAFTTDTREDKTKFTKLRDDAPGWVKDDDAADKDGFCLMLRAHRAVDDRLPDDWFYESAYFIARALAERDDVEDMREAVSEIADAQVDVYNTKLAHWLASHLYNQSLCDEAVADGFTDGKDIAKTMQAGQFRALEAIAHSLIDSIEAEAERRENEQA